MNAIFQKISDFLDKAKAVFVVCFNKSFLVIKSLIPININSNNIRIEQPSNKEGGIKIKKRGKLTIEWTSQTWQQSRKEKNRRRPQNRPQAKSSRKSKMRKGKPSNKRR